MSLKEKLGNLGANLDTGLAHAGTVLNKGKAKVYGIASRVEHDIANEKTVLGGLAATVQKTAATVSEKVQATHADIKARGGYKKAAAAELEVLSTRIDRYFTSVETAVENTFYSQGKFDEAKAQAFLKAQTQTARRYGEKFVTTVATALTTARETVITDYRSLVPSLEELMTKYTDVGTQYSGILLRPDYEACIKFHSKAEKKLPSGRQYRVAILNDIKASASASKAELLAFYETSKDASAARKAKIADALLK